MPNCRFCHSPLEIDLIDLGQQPLANAYLTRDQLEAGVERSYPLHARVCERCWLVQVDDPVANDVIFNDEYAYFSSYSASWVEHARRYADAMLKRFRLGPDSLVAEIASNDGYLLQHFLAAKIPVVGIEPTANTAVAARAKGIPTEVGFFNTATASAFAEQGLAADLITANNVLAHVPDISDFVAGFPLILKPGGVVTFEFPHLLRMIDLVQFDTIYHEHFFYLSFLAVEEVLRVNGMKAFDVEHLPTHGGSLRLFCSHMASDHKQTKAIKDLRAAEAASGLNTPKPYARFVSRVNVVRDQFLAFLDKAEAQGKVVAAYGAAAKGNTFLNYAGIRAPRIRAVFDANPHKQGRFLPGSHVPILSPASVSQVRPDYLLVLPWNLRAEVREQMAQIRSWGGQFVVAVPRVEIFD